MSKSVTSSQDFQKGFGTRYPEPRADIPGEPRVPREALLGRGAGTGGCNIHEINIATSVAGARTLKLRGCGVSAGFPY